MVVFWLRHLHSSSVIWHSDRDQSGHLHAVLWHSHDAFYAKIHTVLAIAVTEDHLFAILFALVSGTENKGSTERLNAATLSVATTVPVPFAGIHRCHTALILYSYLFSYVQFRRALCSQIGVTMVLCMILIYCINYSVQIVFWLWYWYSVSDMSFRWCLDYGILMVYWLWHLDGASTMTCSWCIDYGIYIVHRLWYYDGAMVMTFA